MTALGDIRAGGRVTAGMLQAVAPLSATRGSSQSVNTLTLTDDDTLLLPLLANATYRIQGELYFTGAATGGGDLQIGWALPAEASGYVLYERGNASSLAFAGPFADDWTAPPPAGTNGSTVMGMTIKGRLFTSAAAGNLQLKWCKANGSSGSGTATSMLAASCLDAWQVA
jgi:hypothetical protein